MEWTAEAQETIRKVPFFVRKRVRARVEKEAAAEGKQLVTLAEVRATQARYLSNMETDIKGYQIETCFGTGGCPNRAVISGDMVERIQSFMAEQNLLDFLKQRVPEGLKYHHEFRIAVADCPNACSQPQIRDIGIIGVCSPAVTSEPCSACNACVDTCKEDAIQLEEGCPAITKSCIQCGQCISVCPTGTLDKGAVGYRILLGGKLGRHPRLGEELPGIYDEDSVISIIRDCLSLYKQHCRHGERFAEVIQSLKAENPSALPDIIRLPQKVQAL
jgi:dissimilatory sulfite reductase (desulfoviridin) alpha/beta subunit